MRQTGRKRQKGERGGRQEAYGHLVSRTMAQGNEVTLQNDSSWGLKAILCPSWLTYTRTLQRRGKTQFNFSTSVSIRPSISSGDRTLQSDAAQFLSFQLAVPDNISLSKSLSHVHMGFDSKPNQVMLYLVMKYWCSSSGKLSNTWTHMLNLRRLRRSWTLMFLSF